MSTQQILYRASILHFPDKTNTPNQDFQYFDDGALLVKSGKIVALGEYAVISKDHSCDKEIDYSGKLLTAGFIDSHVHFPQTEMIASYGEQLLSWLNTYTFPTENKFTDYQYAKTIADQFIQQLMRNGTTTAIAYSTVHPQACDALFEVASQYNMMMIAGKVCMDRHCPDYLSDTPETAQQQSADLIEKWHGTGRNYYAITPRFAPTSTERQLHLLGELAQQYPDVFIQSHLSETQEEIAWVKQVYPNHAGYLDVYDSFNLVRERAVYGHCIHLSDTEWQCIKERGASVAFCPSSNLFLGSGLFDYHKAQQHDVDVCLASDVGAGTSFNMLRTYAEAYKVGQLKGQSLCALTGLYLMTQGAASAHQLSNSVGNLNPGSDADFVVLDPHFNELSSLRASNNDSPAEHLFSLSFLGDDRAVSACYVAGKNHLTQDIQETTHALA